MSGGFFRGTSADQDTRFSNKQAKLLKSQKFAPELDHLVDVSKVKMDVVKPWIAHRVTELLGFEDEVLINFIYGLLDGKEINGKQVQIQITGFMEKNTGKFMKELWGLLISAQSNVSGVPQQFLDAKEEEIRKKKAESDRINSEIQKKKELEQEKSKMDGEVDALRDADDAFNRISKNLIPRASSAQAEDEKESDGRNGLRRRSRISRSPHSAGHFPSSPRITRSRSISKSLSNSRSHSGGRRKSDSISRSPPPRGHSRSVERRYRYPQRARSPVRWRSPYSRRRLSSHSWGRSPSPRRRRSITPARRTSPAPRRCRSPSPVQRRSPSPRRHRSPSPIRRRSPFARRRRSPSPFRRRSPPPRRRRTPSPVRRRTPSPVRRRTLSLVRRRSPSPIRRHSPPSMHRRSPLHRQTPSPDRRRSPGPTRKKSPSPSWHRSPSPRLRSPSPARRRSSKQRRRSPLGSPQQRNHGSPYRSHSPAYRSRRSLSTDHDVNTNGVGSKGDNDNHAYERFPVRRGRNGPDSGAHQPAISIRSPQQDSRGKIDARRELPISLPSPAKSPSRSESSPSARNSSPSGDRSLSESPVRRKRERAASADNPVWQTRDRVLCHESPEIDKVEGVVYARGDGGKVSDSPRRRHHSPKAGSHKNVPVKEPSHGEHSSGVSGRRSGEFQHRVNDRETSMKDQEKKSEKVRLRSGTSQQASHIMEEVIYGSGRIEGARSSPVDVSDKSPNPRSLHKVHSREDYEIDEKKRSRSHNTVDSSLKEKTYSAQKSMRSVDTSSKTAYGSSDSEKNDRNKSDDLEKRKHKRSKRHETASEDDASYDSDVDGKKEAKRKRKEEKRLRKEERRRRRQERHRRREERRAGKLKAKPMDTVTPPSDIERNRNGTDDSDGQAAAKRDSHPSDTEEMESEQKILEIELRKKALESLRARKAINP